MSSVLSVVWLTHADGQATALSSLVVHILTVFSDTRVTCALQSRVVFKKKVCLFLTVVSASHRCDSLLVLSS